MISVMNMEKKTAEKQTNTELNNELYEACTAENADFSLIEDLLVRGADPLGPTNEWLDPTLGELFCVASANMEDHLAYLDARVPELVRLFVKHGMDINMRPDIPEDDYASPLWDLAFWCTPNAIKTLHILLESGLKTPELEEFVSHFIMEAAYIDGDIHSEEHLDYLICGLKMIMLSASYEEILSSSAYLREVIAADNTETNNKEILYRFRDYDRFSYVIDKTACSNLRHGIADATVIITDAESNEVVWTFRF